MKFYEDDSEKDAGHTFAGLMLDRRRLKSSCIKINLNNQLLANCTRKEIIEQLLVRYMNFYLC